MTIAVQRIVLPFTLPQDLGLKATLAVSMVLHLGLVWFVSHQNLTIPSSKPPVDMVLALEPAPPKPKPIIEPPKPPEKKQPIPLSHPLPVQKTVLAPTPVHREKPQPLKKVAPALPPVASAPSLSLSPVQPTVTTAAAHPQPAELPHTVTAVPPTSSAAAAKTTIESATPVAARPASQNTKAVPTWKGKLLGRLESRKRYPKVARELHQEGIAYLRFAMDRRGRLLTSHLEKSSGVPILDEETLALAHRAEPFPAPPSEMPGDRIELVVPIQFFLK